MNKKKITVAIFWSIISLLGLLWFLQGSNLVHIKPILCFADCQVITGYSMQWQIIGCLAFLIGMFMIYKSLKHKKHIIIYSHGFAVLKDDNGLFTDIAQGLSNMESILFDYYKLNEDGNEIIICPFSKQVEILNDVVSKTIKNNPDATIDLIAHSQGTITAAMANPNGIRKAIMLSPVFNMDINKSLDRYKTKPGVIIDLDGISKIPSSTGLTKIIPKEYWQERQKIQSFVEYNNFAKKTELIFIQANQDELIPKVDLSPLDSKIKVLSLDGDHGFSGEDRGKLIKLIKESL